MPQSKLVCGSVWPKNDDDDDDDNNNAPPEDISSPWIPLPPPRLLKVPKVDRSRAERLGLGDSLIGCAGLSAVSAPLKSNGRSD